MEQFLRLIREKQREGCDLDRVFYFCIQLGRIGRAAMIKPGTDGPSELQELSRFLLSSSYLQLVQGLLGNTLILKAEASRVFSSITFNIRDSTGLLSIGPESLAPRTYGFSRDWVYLIR